MRYQLDVDIESPLVITPRRATGNVLDTLEHIPGATIRGALAQASMEKGWKPEGADFQHLFLGSASRFGDCRRGPAAPLSARACADDREGRRHALVDLLLARGAGVEVPFECLACGAKLVAPYGDLTNEDGRTVALKGTTRRVAHVQIDAERGRAESGQFHTSRVMDAGDRLQAEIRTSKDGGPALENLLGAGLTLWVGRGRTRGQGRVTLRIRRKNVPVESAAEVEKRLVSFQREAAAKWKAFEGHMVMVLTLESPALLLDRWLLTRAWLEPADVSEGLKDYRVIACFTQLKRISGWHAAGRLPKADVDAVAEGATFLLGRQVPDIAVEANRIAASLAGAQEEGLGERTIEGFGRFRLNDAFHLATGALEKNR